ncbi:carboxylic ester hydrolase [Fusarium longipes]|uniref:Carboxylic ester hydrolase n=1 Tax=Fusarium longipes TaxID=694270 RepID=A0A395SGJ3_9HYPO|nr:carboxylic ester hydrolase [Fusarium longipes]
MPKSIPNKRWRAWTWEYWALAGSLVSLAVMITLLRVFDGKKVFAWNTITLNTIVSILSLVTKANLAYILAECMAQWKWLLFADQERPLMDFDRIDAATRGPLGSLRVLLRTRKALNLQFGAALTLLVVGLDPFAQQIVQLRQNVVFEQRSAQQIGDVALISRATSYSMGQTTVLQDTGMNATKYNYTVVNTQIPLSMESAIMTGLSRSPWEVARETLVQCPTGNCTWNQFNTLGVCHKCNNITSDLRRVKDFGDALFALGNYQFDGESIPSTAFSLPNGHFIANIDGCPPYSGIFAKCDKEQPLVIYSDDKYVTTSFGTGNPNKTNSMKEIDTLIWSMSVIYPDVDWVNKTSPNNMGNKESDSIKWPDVPLHAMECALHYCVKTIDSAVEGNQLVENITEATEAIRDPDSWQRFPERQDNLPENIPPDDEVDSLEFNSRYSTVGYSGLILKFPNNETESWYSINSDSVFSISAHFQQLFKKNYTEGIRMKREMEKKLGKGAVGINGATLGLEQEDLSTKAYPPALNGIWTWTRTNMTSTFESLATSMTNEIRRNYEPRSSQESRQDMGRFRDGTMTELGRVGLLTVVYDVRWPWIALHVAMLLFVSVFLCITLMNSGSSEAAPLWKSSTLATLRHGYQVRDVLAGADTVEDMETKARRAYIKVQRTDSDEDILLQRHIGPKCWIPF